MSRGRTLVSVAEPILLALTVGGSVLLARASVDGVLAKAARTPGDLVRDPSVVLRECTAATWVYVGAFAVLGCARAISARRGRSGNVAVPLLLPALAGVVGLGLALQLGYGDPVHRTGFAGPTFANGLALGAGIACLPLLYPRDPLQGLHRLRWVLGLGLAGLLVALALFGSGPAGSDTKINLGPVQPLEAAKLGFVLLVAPYLGARAVKLRYQRTRLAFLRLPRPRLLLPAVATLVLLQTVMFVVRDLGPVLVVSVVFFVLFYLVTRSPGFVVLALALVGGALRLVTTMPAVVPSQTVAERVAMWADPWLNALPGGDQLARGLWAFGVGGLFGQGLGAAPVGALPAGHNDMAIAHLAEELGAVGVIAYLTGILAIALSGVWIAARARTPERALLAGGLAALLAAQAALIFAGSTGLLPLTGIVAPFISAGRSSMAAFLTIAVLILRLAEGGQVRSETEELREIRGAARSLGLVLLALVLGAAWHAHQIATAPVERSTARGIVTVQRDGTVRHVHDPRVESILDAIPRGTLSDRKGRPFAESLPDRTRRHPLGAALGTLLGAADDRRLRPVWALERIHDARLRGYGARGDGPAVWLGSRSGRERVLFAVAGREERAADRARAVQLADGGPVRLLPLPSPDLGAIARVARLRPLPRAAAVQAMVADAGSREVRLSLDADLQLAVAGILQSAAKKGKGAAAVVLSADTGEVLARAQAPDLDLDDARWLKRLDDGDPQLVGAYGAFPDRTGLRGFLQAGSIAKVYTALAAARGGLTATGEGCGVRPGPIFGCTARDADGPVFTRPGWVRGVHDYHTDPIHGQVDLVRALAVSCNVYFGQLGLALGPEPLRELADSGVDIGWQRGLDPGTAGSRQLASTAFGQGAAAMSPMQAARLVAAVGSGGHYRRCPPSMELGAPCETASVVDDPAAVVPILAGLRAVITTGTGRGLSIPQDVRFYGKTGTADAPGLSEESPFGVRPGDEGARPHSWFVALAEPTTADACAPTADARLAIAVAVARGGSGKAAAGEAAAEIVRAAHALGWFERGPE